MTLSNNQLKHVCLKDQGSQTCRYLIQDVLDRSKCYCQKLKPIEKAIIDKEVNQFIIDCKKRKLNPDDLTTPLGDNCEGYLALKNIPQGYDC